MQDMSFVYFVISEIKLKCSFHMAQFHINNYKVRARGYQDKNGGKFVEGCICKKD